MAITVVIAPAVPVFDAQSLTLGQSLIVAIQQMLIGFAMGLVLRMVFTAHLGAHVIALQMGLGFAEFRPAGRRTGTHPQPVLHHDRHVYAHSTAISVLQLLLESFQTLPIGPMGSAATLCGHW